MLNIAYVQSTYVEHTDSAHRQIQMETHTIMQIMQLVLVVHSAMAFGVHRGDIPLDSTVLKSPLFPLPVPPLLLQYLLTRSGSAERVALGLRRQRCCSWLFPRCSTDCLFRFRRCSNWRQLLGGRCACCEVQTTALCRSCCS